MVPMRDGVKLATDVYLPEGDGPWPTALIRTPYNKDGARGFWASFIIFGEHDRHGSGCHGGTGLPARVDVPDAGDPAVPSAQPGVEECHLARPLLINLKDRVLSPLNDFFGEFPGDMCGQFKSQKRTCFRSV